MPYPDHLDHVHVNLDERVIGAPIPRACLGKPRFATKPAAVALVQRAAPCP